MQASEMDVLGLNLSAPGSSTNCLLDFDMTMPSSSLNSNLLAMPVLPSFPSMNASHFMPAGGLTLPQDLQLSTSGAIAPSNSGGEALLSHDYDVARLRAYQGANAHLHTSNNQHNPSFVNVQQHGQNVPIGSSGGSNITLATQIEDGADGRNATEAEVPAPTVAQPRYQCPICNKALSSNWYRKIHMRVHTGEGLLSCEHCGKKFPSEARLTVHLRVHTGEVCSSLSSTSRQNSSSAPVIETVPL